jgi:DNA-binding NarL/FixJ family response regulator
MGPGDERFAHARLRVFIVDDCERVRHGLADSLGCEGFEVVGRCPASGAAAEDIAATCPDVCMLGLGTSGESAIDLCRAMGILDPRIPCVVLALRYRPVDAVASFRAGAVSYVLAGLPPKNLAFALTAAARGRGGN